MTRPLLILLAALVLTACNAVVSEKPLFSARDAPELKPGLWVLMEDATCQFDPANPPDRWPECASRLVFDGRTMSDPAGERPPLPYVFARGTPRILQLQMSEREGAGEERSLYLYLAVKPEAGRPVTAAEAWLVQCGPPPEGATGGNKLTEAPLPGLTIRDQTCFAVKAPAVRNAARASADWGDHMRLVWVGPVPR
jgi:hypothetical protein